MPSSDILKAHRTIMQRATALRDKMKTAEPQERDRLAGKVQGLWDAAMLIEIICNVPKK